MYFIFCIETLSVVGSEVLKKYPELGALKVVFLPQVSINDSSVF